MQYVCRLSELEGEPARVEVGGKPFVLVRENDQLVLVQAYCPHRGAPLADAHVRRGHFVCAWHRSVFSLRTGAPVVGPSKCRLLSYPCTVRDDHVFVEMER